MWANIYSASLLSLYQQRAPPNAKEQNIGRNNEETIVMGKKNHNKGSKAATEVLTAIMTASNISEKAVLVATPGSFHTN